MQLAVLRTYLEHNRKPEVVIHNLDAFSFITTREVYDLAQYVPYLDDKELYVPLRKINGNTWKTRYLPLYGYVVDDLNFSWVLGLGGFFGWSPREEYFLGFNPRTKRWTDDFQQFKVRNPNGVTWAIEPAGVQVLQDLVRLCREEGIQLMFVYSPEYVEMQKLTRNRADVFSHFHELAACYQIPLWDYSDWQHAGDKQYFQNSQHLNAYGAEVFSRDLGERLRAYLATATGYEP
jgi:hypothetical protein